MSAIAKPMVHSTNTALERPAQRVNLENVVSYEAAEINGGSVNTPETHYVIRFIMPSVDQSPKAVEWNYGTNNTERDNDLADLDTYAAQVFS